MHADRIRKLRSAGIVSATVLFGISWSFTLLHVRTSIYPLLWALAMPPLAFYYFSGPSRLRAWKHMPAAALSIYAVILWQVSHGYGAAGLATTVAGVALSALGAWLGARIRRADTSATAPVVAPVARSTTALGSGVAKRRRLRNAPAPARAAARR